MAACWKVPTLALAWLFVANGTALASPASIDSVWASNVTETDATLNAKINPNSLYTAYEFEIDTDARYDYTKRACPLQLPGYASCMIITVVSRCRRAWSSPSRRPSQRGCSAIRRPASTWRASERR